MMRLILITMGLIALVGCAHPNTNYESSQRESYKIHDANMRLKGFIVDGKIYDENLRYKGRIE